PINVRYARDFREDLDSLKRVLVPVPMNGDTAMPAQLAMAQNSNTPILQRSSIPAQIPISMLADITYKTGPPSIRNENGQLVDIPTDDSGCFVRAASQRIGETVQFPAGYYIQWAGQFEYQQRAFKRFLLLFPFTLVIIFVLIYLNTRSVVKTLIVILAVPFSL